MRSFILILFLTLLSVIVWPIQVVAFPFTFFGSSAYTSPNYYGTGADGSVTISSDTSLTSTSDSDAIVKNYVNLTIDSGKTLTVSNRNKGLILYVTGNLVVNGTISMSKRGASVDATAAGVSASGLIWRRRTSGGSSTNSGTGLLTGMGTAAINAEDNQATCSSNCTLYTVARAGASGAAGVTNAGQIAGAAGSNGTTGQSGGGGSGGVDATGPSGSGSAGTCFSGGTGGGAMVAAGSSAGNGVANGGAGGKGGNDNGGNPVYGCSGGSGNPGGIRTTAGAYNGTVGQDGTGGLLVIIVKGTVTVGAAGVISADGADGGDGGSPCGGGGATGGGNILILSHGTYTNSGSVHASGGAGLGSVGPPGGAGGTGSVQQALIL